MASPPSHLSLDDIEDGSPEPCWSFESFESSMMDSIAGAFEKHYKFSVPPSPKSPLYHFGANFNDSEIRDQLRIIRGPELGRDRAEQFDNPWEYLKIRLAELDQAREFLARKRAPRSQRRRGLNVSGAGTSLAEGTTSQAKFHTGVRKRRDGKYTSRVCVPGAKSKMDLGEFMYFNHAVAAYRIGAKYLKKPFSSTPEEEFFKKLPPLPDSLLGSHPTAAKLAWIRKTARQHSSESPYMHRDGLGDASPPTSTTLQQPDAAGCSSLGSTPPNLHQEVAWTTSGSAPSTPPNLHQEVAWTTLGSAPPQYRCGDQFQGGQQPDAVGPCSFLVSVSPNDGMFGSSNSALTASASAPIERCAGFQNGPTLQQPDAAGCSSLVSSPPNLHQEVALTTSGSAPPTPPTLHQEVALTTAGSAPPTPPRELRVLVSQPRTQKAAPAVVMTDAFLGAIIQLRQQGCEVQVTTRQIEETEKGYKD